jgi:hypothetical protein
LIAIGRTNRSPRRVCCWEYGSVPLPYHPSRRNFVRTPQTVASLENLGRVRLTKNFFFREFLYSEIAVMHGMHNVPDNPDLAIKAGQGLCEHLLEPLQATFGRISIRSGFRSAELNAFGNKQYSSCARKGKSEWNCRARRFREGSVTKIACSARHARDRHMRNQLQSFWPPGHVDNAGQPPRQRVINQFAAETGPTRRLHYSQQAHRALSK